MARTMDTPRRRAVLLAALGSFTGSAALAQSARPLRLIVPFPPGGSTDILARAIGAKLGAALGQTVLIDNKPGAGGSLGATEAARAEADGNTLLMGHVGTLAVNPALYPKLPSVTDLIGGQVDATLTGAPAVLPHVRTGRLRALAVSSARRLPSLPDVPTVAESGYPGFDADQWYGIVAPAGTPEATVARLNVEINKALQQPAVVQQMAAEGAIPTPGSPKAFGDLIAREIPRWTEVVKAGNVKPD